jgi:hypothetical protein
LVQFLKKKKKDAFINQQFLIASNIMDKITREYFGQLIEAVPEKTLIMIIGHKAHINNRS